MSGLRLNMTIIKFKPRREKTGLRGFRTGPTQTRLLSHRRRLDAWNSDLESKEMALSMLRYCAADLRLCFRINQFFSRHGSVITVHSLSTIKTPHPPLIRLH